MLPHFDDQLSAGWCLLRGGSTICTCIGTMQTHAATFPIHDECPVGCGTRSCNQQPSDEHRQCLVSSIRGPTDSQSAFCAYPRRVAEPQLTHVDAKGAARMVDVSGKDVTIRRAVAAGTVTTTTSRHRLAIRSDSLPKGDALATARIAGIMGAKRTPDLIAAVPSDCVARCIRGIDSPRRRGRYRGIRSRRPIAPASKWRR